MFNIPIRSIRVALLPKAEIPPSPQSGRWEAEPSALGPETPLIDIHEGPDGLILEADLPGVSAESLTINVEENVLTLSASPEPMCPPGAKAIYEESRPEGFRRSFILSDEVDRERITADLRDGVLRLHLPKGDRARTRRIEVKSS